MITGDFLQASFDLEASSLEIQMASDCYNRIKEGATRRLVQSRDLLQGLHDETSHRNKCFCRDLVYTKQ